MDLKNKNNFSKDELIACSNGDLFGPGNGRLPNKYYSYLPFFDMGHPSKFLSKIYKEVSKPKWNV